MPKSPKGHKRPADVISNAVLVMNIATGEAEETTPSRRRAGGVKGGPARARALTPDQRSDMARVAATARWKKG
jgi:hypothetical protein